MINAIKTGVDVEMTTRVNAAASLLAISRRSCVSIRNSHLWPNSQIAC
jgi:hypothetical protein